LESSHALAFAMEEAARRPKDQVVVVCLSGRGDKDLDIVTGEAAKAGGAL
jgi:tryptophan synthase beta chain